MGRRSKVREIAGLLERRIMRGDYVVRELPTEMALAAEIGASRLTARRAVHSLVEQGLLVRQSNGRFSAKAQGAATGRKMRIGVLSPTFVSPDQFRVSIERTAEQSNASVHSFGYTHWEDAVFTEALSSVNGLFLHPLAEPIPKSLADQIVASAVPTVVLDSDFSTDGLVSLLACAPSAFDQIFDHFAELGHRRLDCLNTQPFVREIEQRVESWNTWRALNKVDGTLINEPVVSFKDPTRRAYDVIKRMIADGTFSSKAIFCTTSATATGAIRALYESQIVVGRDVALSGANDTGGAWCSCPSVTSLQPPDLSPYLSVCFEWMRRGGKDWLGPRLMAPSKVALFKGESTMGSR